MRKRLREERTDLGIKSKIYNTVLFIFLFPLITYTQIPINGFCRFQEFPSRNNSNLFFPIDFNLDGWRDIVTVPEGNRNFYVQVFEKNQFTNPTERFFPYQITGLIPYNGSDTRGKKLAFISRQSRRAGILMFSKSGSASIQSQIQLKSYPSNIAVADINNNGRQDILISGNAFLGLSILSLENNRLRESTINNSGIFSYSSFIDLDYDLYPDIAAVDILTNEIILFYNDKTGGFRAGRSIELKEEVKGFEVGDINSNGFNDIIYINNNGFEILLGDSVSSFVNRINIESPVPPDKFTILDFNADGYNDIAYINYATGNAYIIYAKSINEFYSPVLYFQKEGLVDIGSFVDRGGRKLTILDKNGKIYLIDKISNREENFSIALSSKPGYLGSINFPEEAVNGIYYIDENNLYLKILLGSRGNQFEKYFSIPLSKAHTNVIVDDTQSGRKTFFCFSKGGRVIEIFRFEYSEMNYKRRVLYTDAPIEELKLTGDRLKDRQSIFVLTNKYGKIQLQSFDFRDFRYVSAGLDSIASRVETAALSFNIHKEVFYFSKSEDRLYLNKSIIDRKVQPPINIAYININPVESYKMEIKSYNYYNTPEKPVFAWVSDQKRTRIYTIRSGYQQTISIDNFSASTGYTKFYSGLNRNDLFLYDQSIGLLKKISFPGNYRNYIVTDLFESLDINSYIVTQTSKGKELLIYTDSSDKLVKFRYSK